VLLVTVDVDASASVVAVPMLVIGLGMGSLASQLGSVTVSAVPDELSPEVGGLQNTATQFGASIGTALAGSVLIASLTASFLSGIARNPDVPPEVVTKADTQLSSGAPFVSNTDLEAALRQAGLDEQATGAIVDENAKARIDGLRASLALLDLFAIIALFFTRRIPTEQPGGHAPDPG
jgi:hypothetical protein